MLTSSCCLWPLCSSPLWMICDGIWLCLWAGWWFSQLLLRWPLTFFSQHRAVSGGRAMQSKLVMWKSWDFLTQFVQVIIWLLLKWQWGVAELAFARSGMGSLIEAVSRSAEERRSNQVIMLWEISIWNVSCAEHLWNVILKSEHFSVIWKLEQLSFWVIKYCASVKLMFST